MLAQPDLLDRWFEVCALAAIVPNTGVTCLVGKRQVAVFRLGDDTLYALDAFDPFCEAHVLGRGIVGSHRGQPKVSSPMFRQSFCLNTGVCFDEPGVSLATFPVRLVRGKVWVRATETAALPARNAGLVREGRA